MRKTRTRAYLINLNRIYDKLIFVICFILLIIILAYNKNIIKFKTESFLCSTFKYSFYITDKNENPFAEEISAAVHSLLGIDVKNPTQIITVSLAMEQDIMRTYIPDNNQVLAPDADISQNSVAKDITVVSKGNCNYKNISIKNETNLDINIEGLLNKNLSFKNSKGNTEVIIVHTHATESYGGTARSNNDNENVVNVGTKLKKELESRGVNCVHITKHHDYPSYNGSYKNSLKSVEKALKENVGTKIVLDVHRDAVSNQPLKVTTTIDNKKAAQIMFVVGSNVNGGHEGWEDNLTFALEMQNYLTENYNNFARPINVRNERFNQFSAPGHIIVEVGGDGNTMEEALNSTKYIADAVAKILNE